MALGASEDFADVPLNEVGIDLVAWANGASDGFAMIEQQPLVEAG